MTQASVQKSPTASSRRRMLLMLPFVLALAACSGMRTAAPPAKSGVQSGSSLPLPDARHPLAAFPEGAGGP